MYRWSLLGEKINSEFQTHRKQLEGCASILKRILHFLEEFTILGTSLYLELSRVSIFSKYLWAPNIKHPSCLELVKYLSVFIDRHVGRYKGRR